MYNICVITDPSNQDRRFWWAWNSGPGPLCGEDEQAHSSYSSSGLRGAAGMEDGGGEEERRRGITGKKKSVLRIPSYQREATGNEGGGSAPGSSASVPQPSASSFSQAFSFVKSSEFYSPPPAPPPDPSQTPENALGWVSGLVSLRFRDSLRSCNLEQLLHCEGIMAQHSPTVRWGELPLLPLLLPRTCLRRTAMRSSLAIGRSVYRFPLGGRHYALALSLASGKFHEILLGRASSSSLFCRKGTRCLSI